MWIFDKGDDTKINCDNQPFSEAKVSKIETELMSTAYLHLTNSHGDRLIIEITEDAIDELIKSAKLAGSDVDSALSVQTPSVTIYNGGDLRVQEQMV